MPSGRDVVGAGRLPPGWPLLNLTESAQICYRPNRWEQQAIDDCMVHANRRGLLCSATFAVAAVVGPRLRQVPIVNQYRTYMLRTLGRPTFPLSVVALGALISYVIGAASTQPACLRKISALPSTIFTRQIQKHEDVERWHEQLRQTMIEGRPPDDDDDDDI